MQHGRPRQGSFITIITAVMVATLINSQQSANGQMATHYVCANACPAFPQPSSDLWDVMKNADEDDIIWVGHGTYHPDCFPGIDGIKCSFELKAGVSVYGNFIGSEIDLDDRKPLDTAYESILDGTLGSGAALHVVRVDGGGAQPRLIDGFTIRNGHARGYVDCFAAQPPDYANSGGGMLVDSEGGIDLGVVMCRFENNLAGADACPPGLVPEDCNLGFCNASDFRGLGGAIALRGIATTGGPARVTRLHNCVFANNRVATGHFNGLDGPMGGALYKESAFGELEIMNSLFVGNVVDAESMACCQAGGGYHFLNNQWGAGGGAISLGSELDCSPAVNLPSQIWNCTIYGNEVYSSGSNPRRGWGIWASREHAFDPQKPKSPALHVFNTIVHGNRAFAVGSETHDDLGGEEDIDQIEFPTSVLCVHSPYVAFSNIEGGWPSWASGSDNINADPEFVDASAGDFRLVAGSPCIDAGTNIDIPLDVLNISRTSGHMTLPVPDLDHEPRIFGCVADMGAFEWWHAADLNGDHMVNFADLLILLNAWGTCPSPCPEDLDGNGEVNFADMLILLSAWSNACSGSESELGSIEECITRLGLSDPEALAACIEAMIMNDTP